MKQAAKTLFVVLIAMTAAAWAKAETAPEPTRTFIVAYRLNLDAEGKLEKLVLQDEAISQTLADNLEKQIRSWAYSPASVGGKPARTETNLWVTVMAVTNGKGGYDVSIVDATTGGAVAKGTLLPPKYPVDQMRMGVEAVMRLLVSYDSDGKVIRAERPGKPLRGMRPFEQAGEQAAKNWRFDPEKVDGIGVPGQVIVPLMFCIPPNNCASLLRGSKEKEKLAAEVARQSIPMDSRVAIRREL